MKKIYSILALSIIILISTSGYSQITFGGNSYPGGTNYVGWDNSASVTLDIKNNSISPTKSIDFYINNIKFLQVLTSGDLNTVVGTNGYMINNNWVLRHNGITSSIYVGVGAGNTNATFSNTFVGYRAGINSGNSSTLDWSGSRNTFVGHTAGASNDYGHENSFFGDSAGYSTVGSIGPDSGGYRNTFLGTSAGFSNVNGRSNTYIGYKTGYYNIDNYNTMTGRAAGFDSHGSDNCYYGKDAADAFIGSNNCYYGAHSGSGFLTGNNNSVYGHVSGQQINGDDNCIYGARAGTSFVIGFTGNWNTFYGSQSGLGSGVGGTPPTTLNFSSAIGANAKVNTDNKIILGDNIGSNNEHIHVGIGLSDDQVFGGPRSELELNTDPAMSVSGVSGSGLQFRQLISTSPNNPDTYIAPFGRVLTVDVNGKVKLTDDKTYLNDCSNPYSLITDAGLLFRNNRIYYTGQDDSRKANDMNNSIGIGYNCGTALPGKFSVDQNFVSGDVQEPTTAGYFHNNDATTSSAHLFFKRGIQSICEGLSINDKGPWNIGGDFGASNSANINIAVKGFTNNLVPDNYGRTSIGGYFQAQKSHDYNFGVYAACDLSGHSGNCGIYAECPSGSCGFGSCSDAAGIFNGDVYTTSSTYYTSDIQLKDNIQPLQNASSIIKLLNPKIFTFRQNQFSRMTLPSGIQAGLIAQEIQNVLPNLVKIFALPPQYDSLGNIDTTGSGYQILSVNYVGIIPYMISAVKEQQNSIDSLLSTMNDLQSQINHCCGTGTNLKIGNSNSDNQNYPSIDVQLADITTIVLEQNSPNPFNEETFINYIVPKEVSNAFIIIYDNIGQVLKTITISSRGEGSLHVYAEKLSSGIYSYSLIVDGRTIDTKKMVCQK